MHARGIVANPERFELIAVCDVNPERLVPLEAQFGIRKTYRDAEAMLAAERPDVLCFATPPQVRLPLVALGVKYGVRAIAYEKPMALTLAEARRITELCAAARVRTVICHQLKHARHWQKAKEIVDRGGIGDVHTMHATARPSMLRAGTHLVDYMLWLNGGSRARWVIGQVHGKQAYEEDHPCPDYVMGVVQFANGVRGLVEFGTLAPHHMSEEDFWGDGAVTVYGTHGYVRAVMGAGWQAVTRSSDGQLQSGPPDLSPQEAQHMQALADWLDDPRKAHPCNAEASYDGLELLIGVALSSVERRRVEIPITPVPTSSVLAQLEKELPDGK